MNSNIKIGVEGDEVVIRINKNDLVFAAENKPDSEYTVVNTDLFADDFCKQLQCPPDSEKVNSVIEEFFDKIIDNVYTDASESIKDSADEED